MPDLFLFRKGPKEQVVHKPWRLPFAHSAFLCTVLAFFLIVPDLFTETWQTSIVSWRIRSDRFVEFGSAHKDWRHCSRILTLMSKFKDFKGTLWTPAVGPSCLRTTLPIGNTQSKIGNDEVLLCNARLFEHFYSIFIGQLFYLFPFSPHLLSKCITF